MICQMIQVMDGAVPHNVDPTIAINCTDNYLAGQEGVCAYLGGDVRYSVLVEQLR